MAWGLLHHDEPGSRGETTAGRGRRFRRGCAFFFVGGLRTLAAGRPLGSAVRLSRRAARCLLPRSRKRLRRQHRDARAVCAGARVLLIALTLPARSACPSRANAGSGERRARGEAAQARAPEGSCALSPPRPPSRSRAEVLPVLHAPAELHLSPGRVRLPLARERSALERNASTFRG